MSDIKMSFSELVGQTPVLRLTRMEEARGLTARLLVKLEYFNPAGSVKDRVALEMINDYEARGLIAPGATIVEPTSGNTGIGLAAVAASRGYKAVLVMPEGMSVERVKILAAYGARLIQTDKKLGMKGAQQKAEELVASIPGAVMAGQFTNPANPRAHRKTTGPEIWRQTDGEIDAFVAGVGTGGTITGVGGYLKEKNRNLRVIAVEPFNSPLLSGGVAGPHGLQGIGANFVPEVLDRALLDEIIPIKTCEAYDAARELASTQGVLVGISSGAALAAALRVAARPEFAGRTVMALLPDTGDRYLSTELYK